MTIQKYNPTLLLHGSILINSLDSFFCCSMIVLMILFTMDVSTCSASGKPVIAEAEPSNRRTKPIPITFSPELDPIIAGHLQTFGYSNQDVFSLFAVCKKNFTTFLQPNLLPLIGTHDPHLIAVGLWRALQENLLLQSKGHTSLSMQSLMAATLCHTFSLQKSPLALEDLSSLTNLMKGHPYLHHVDLYQIGLNDDGVKIICELLHLKELFLEDNSITDRGASYLAEHPRIEVLRLWRNQIGPQGAIELAKNKVLRSLGLFANPVRNKGAIALAQNTTLTALDLRRTKMGDRGARAFKDTTTLTSLVLRDNHITDKGIEGFEHNRNLTHLELSQNPITEEKVLLLENLMHNHGYLHALRNPASAIKPLSSRKTVRILAIDGGGIRGVLPSMVLHRLETELSQDGLTAFPFSKHLDLMAGTSTGGLICLGLSMPGGKGQPKYTSQTLVDLYTSKGKEIFPKGTNLLKPLTQAAYSPKGLEENLNTYFQDSWISTYLTDLLITSFDLQNNCAQIFESRLARQNPAHDFKAKDVGRATSAAPTYLPAATIKNRRGEEFTLVDGGIYANNPSLLALKRAQDLYPKAKKYILISLGTGAAPKKDQRALAKKGLLKWGMNIADVLMTNAAEYTEKLMQEEIQKDARIKYLRLQPVLEKRLARMDNVSDENIDGLKATIEAFFQTSEGRDILMELKQEFAKDYISQRN